LFGEGITNDAISILLFNSLLHSNINEFGVPESLMFMGQFFLNCLISIAIGSVVGLVTTWLLKKGEALEEDPAF